MNLDKSLSKRKNKFEKYIDNEYIIDRMTDEKMWSWLWANIEGLQYITNKAFIENSENKNNRVNSAAQELQKQIRKTKFKEINRGGKITLST